ncbi:hypothetical protein NUM3379_42370 [Kineococcus sp. NUM-3379]
MDDGPRAGDGFVLVVVDRVSTYALTVVAAVREVLEAAGVPLLVHVHDYEGVPVPHLLRHGVGHGLVRGVVTLPLTASTTYRELEAFLAQHPGVPVVSVGGASAGQSSVVVDNRAGMADLARHLLAQEGVERIALVRGVPHHPDSLEREEVFRAVLAEHGLALDESLVVDGQFHRNAAHRGVSALLQAGRRFDAVVALNDDSAFGALDALLDHGLGVPGDVRVTGFDDVGAESARRGLTTVGQRLEDVGRCAAELLLELVTGSGTGRAVCLPARPVVRRSSVRVPQVPVPAGADTAAAGPGPGSGTDEMTLVSAAMCLTRGLMSCADEAAAMRELVTNLPRLRISRCFVVLFEPDGGPERVGRLELAWPHEAPHDASRTFPAAEILPPHLSGELRRGCLLVQSLAVAGHELGFVLFEQAQLHLHTAEALPMDLSLTLDGISRRRHLEREVARRTEQLREEIAVRRRVEAALREEVAERRRAEDALHEANAELRRLLHRDGLTGIANRTAFDAALADVWQRHRDGGEDLALLLVDVDHFKFYNDTYGHLRGDEALRAVAQVLDASCRERLDLAARLGGEEFAVLLPATPVAGALVVADSIRRRLRALALEHRASPVAPRLTVSIGVATSGATGGSTARSGTRELVEAADAAMYAAKAAGRNRVVVAGPAAGPVVAQVPAPPAAPEPAAPSLSGTGAEGPG